MAQAGTTQRNDEGFGPTSKRERCMAKVVVFGSLNMDLSIVCGRVPRAGETVLGSGFFTNPGGKGGNQAVAAARSGARTLMLARVGDDTFGPVLVDGLRDAGVDCSYVESSDGYSTGTAMIVRCESENRIIVDPGANRAVDAAGVRALLDEVAEPGDVLLTQLECDVDATCAALDHARELGMVAVLNAAPAHELPNSVLEGLDLLCVNETECEALSGIYPADRWRTLDALRQFRDRGVRHTVVTLGRRGSVTLADNKLLMVRAYHVPAVDSTGAGDAYLGALACQLCNGKGLPEGMRFATAASALAVQKAGAQQSMPTGDQIQQFIADNGAAFTFVPDACGASDYADLAGDLESYEKDFLLANPSGEAHA